MRKKIKTRKLFLGTITDFAIEVNVVAWQNFPFRILPYASLSLYKAILVLMTPFH